jgi:hypothetical protein
MPTVRPPEGMPVLTKGRHRSPRDGACLMEYVSVLAGENFSDRPRCVDPLIVRLAWTVNDASDDELRGMLPELAPRLIGTADGGPLVAPTLVADCCAFARTCLDPMSALPFTHELVRARARLRRVHKRASMGQPARRERLYRGLHAEVVVQQTARAVAVERPDQLPGLLASAVQAVWQVLPSTPAPTGRTDAPQRA